MATFISATKRDSWRRLQASQAATATMPSTGQRMRPRADRRSFECLLIQRTAAGAGIFARPRAENGPEIWAIVCLAFVHVSVTSHGGNAAERLARDKEMAA